MVVQHNLTAMNANRYLGINNTKLSKSLEKLSSGYAINRAGDNAAGLAVSEKMRSQIAGMTQAVKNAQDGISMVQTFEGALTETDSILQRMKTLATQMANGSYDDPVDRTAAQQEFLQLNDELDQIADTDFNGVTVLNGGVMADGTCADGVTATFDAAGHVTSKTTEEGYKGGVIDYTKTAEAPAAAATGDRTEAKDVGADARLEDKGYLDETNAQAAWADGALEGGDAKYLDATFERDKDGQWSLKGVKNDSGEDVNSTLTVTDQSAKNGGFTVTAGGAEISNVVLDDIKGVEGDTVTIRYTNPNGEPPVAPTNIGWQDLTIDGNATVTKADGITAANATAEKIANSTTIALDSGVATDYATNKTMQEGIEKLDDAEVELEFSHANNTNDAAVTVTKIGADTVKQKTSAGAAGDGWSINTNNGNLYYEDALIGKVANAGFKNESNAGEKTTATLKIAIAGYSAGGDSEGPDANIVVADAAADDAADEAYAVSKSDAFSKSEAKMTYTNNITLQVGARTKDAVNFTFEYASTSIGELSTDLDCTAYGLGTNILNLNTQENANKAIDKIDQAINKVSLVRGTFGAIQNRLEHKIDNLNVSVENLTSAESQIRDTNMPQEMMNFTKQQILAQASQSMLAQANQLPQGVLSLLQ